jgi:predicted nucleic acid-binding protein
MLDHSVYDMIYLVLARRNNATLLTMDQRLVASAEKAGVNTA